jgi:choline dehydrogenase-like flavoprotein
LIILDGDFPDDATVSADLAVVGAGPVGIAVALEVAAQGFGVILVESGYETANTDAQKLAEAADWDGSLHAPMSLSVRRQLGGTSTIWGGRCVPYDRVDFENRDHISRVNWPVTYDELFQHYQRACDWLGCGRPAFDRTHMGHLPPAIVPGLMDGAVSSASFERWTLSTNFARKYGEALKRSQRVRVITGLTCTEVATGSGAQRADGLIGRTLTGKRVTIQARAYVLACGGLETTRLMLASRDLNGRALGDHSGHLGRWYMGHVGGVIARVRFCTPPRATVYGYERDIDGTPVRRRFSIASDVQVKHGLPNAIGFLANPDMADPRHRNGILSLAQLTLHSPLGERISPAAQRARVAEAGVPEGDPPGLADRSTMRPHLANIIRDLPSVVGFAVGSGMRRARARGNKVPGLFAAYSGENCYRLQYHGEQIPNRESRVTLADDRDATGMPRLKIDLKFSQRDIDGILRCHEVWDEYLQDKGRGCLEYLSKEPGQAAWSELGAGTHQLGLTRMSARPQDGVVDKHLAVHGFTNVFVASSSVMLTSGQANPTFMVMVLALRLADHLGRHLGRI